MHFVVNICFSFLGIHWFFHSLCPRMLLSSLMKLLYTLRFLTLFLHCCQSLLYCCTFSMQKLRLISDRSIKVFWNTLPRWHNEWPDLIVRPRRAHCGAKGGYDKNLQRIQGTGHSWSTLVANSLISLFLKISRLQWQMDLAACLQLQQISVGVV